MPVIGKVHDNYLDFKMIGPGFPLRHLSGFFGRKYHSTRISRGGSITFRPRSCDAQVIRDIFRNGAYDLSGLKQYDRVMARYQRIVDTGCAPVIIDAGANVGVASAWFSCAFPAAHILAVEPDPDNAAILRLNSRERPTIEVIEAAISSRAGRVALSNPDDQAWSVQTERSETGGIAATTIADILARHGEAKSLFLVKIDIEGFEADLFQENLDWLDTVEVVIIEPHDWLMPGARTSRNFQRAMAERDFELVISGENLIYLRT